LEAQANLSKAHAEAASLRQDSDSKLAAAKLSCGGCAEKAGKLLELQQQLQPTQAMLAEQRQHRKSLEDQLEAVHAELQGAKASLAAAQHAKDQLHSQLHGCLEAPPSAPAGNEPLPGAGYPVYGGYAPGSPTCMQMQMQLVPAEEGLIQRCSALSMQLQQQEVELGSLRQQLLEQQLALSEAQTSCGSAERQLQQAAFELKTSHSAAADASAAAAAAREDATSAQQQAQQLQQTLAAQQPELAANRAQVLRLEAQQQVLLGERTTTQPRHSTQIAAGS
jgi:chromosome segregation ATPase